MYYHYSTKTLFTAIKVLYIKNLANRIKTLAEYSALDLGVHLHHALLSEQQNCLT
jgi:hypothetical protein